MSKNMARRLQLSVCVNAYIHQGNKKHICGFPLTAYSDSNFLFISIVSKGKETNMYSAEK